MGGSDITIPGRKFHWPEIQLNIWLLVIIITSSACLGIYSWFLAVQAQLELESPWVFPYMVSVSILALMFVVLIFVLSFKTRLLPEVIIILAFLLFVLSLVGLIGTSIQLYGSIANVNSNCRNYVEAIEYRGASINTLAWLTQINICNCWKAAFSFQLVSTVFFVWILFMSLGVRREAKYLR